MKTPFKLRSGNTTPFKMMGSSPAKDIKSWLKRAGEKVVKTGKKAISYLENTDVKLGRKYDTHKKKWWE
tara:strand:+ start:1146 stop:1352 length:207 start_codon:yes stop_codon:yes gene_type:complete